MKLTIIIPVYNVEATLERCIESVVHQDFNDYELILVDDGSPDSSPAICDKWAVKDQRIHVIHKENGGLSDARNAGLDIAQGDYITFIDSDDFIDPHTYTPLMSYLEDHPETDILEYPAVLFYNSEKQEDLRFPNQTVYHDMEDYWYHEKAYEHSYAWNKLYRKSLFDEARFPTGVVFEDICTQHLWKQLTAGKSPVDFRELGRWWGTNSRTRSQEEIDIMGTDKNAALFAECKWTNEKVDPGVLVTLVERSNLISYKEKYFYLFAKSGFTKGCTDKAAELGNVTLVAYDEMLKA